MNGEPRRAFIHDDDKYVSLAFGHSGDTLLKMPDPVNGWGDNAVAKAWFEAANEALTRDRADDLGAAAMYEALERIKDECGAVCENFECDHRACKDSYAAWTIADEALAGARTNGSVDPRIEAIERIVSLGEFPDGFENCDLQACNDACAAWLIAAQAFSEAAIEYEWRVVMERPGETPWHSNALDSEGLAAKILRVAMEDGSKAYAERRIKAGAWTQVEQ